MKHTTAKASSSAKNPVACGMNIEFTDDGGFTVTTHYKNQAPPNGSSRAYLPSPDSKTAIFHSAEAAAAHAHRTMGGKGTVHSSCRPEAGDEPEQRMQFDDHEGLAMYLAKRHAPKPVAAPAKA
jgi:hypothetical protein